MELETELRDIKANCVGTFYSWGLDKQFTFGTDSDLDLFRLSILSLIPPIDRFTAFWNNIPSYYRHTSLEALNERQIKIEEKEIKKFKDYLIFYNVPIDMEMVADLWRRLLVLDNLVSTNVSEKWQTSPEDVVELMVNRFSNPYFIHHRRFRPAYVNDTTESHTEFYMVGERDLTSRFTGLLLDDPTSVIPVLKTLTGVSRSSIDSYRERNKLLVYDNTRRPKKQTRQIVW